MIVLSFESIPISIPFAFYLPPITSQLEFNSLIYMYSFFPPLWIEPILKWWNKINAIRFDLFFFLNT